jgi:hypothetical protein
MCAVVEVGAREGMSRVRILPAAKRVTCDFDGADGWLTGWRPPQIKKMYFFVQIREFSKTDL